MKPLSGGSGLTMHGLIVVRLPDHVNVVQQLLEIERWKNTGRLLLHSFPCGATTIQLASGQPSYRFIPISERKEMGVFQERKKIKKITKVDMQSRLTEGVNIGPSIPMF